MPLGKIHECFIMNLDKRLIVGISLQLKEKISLQLK